MAKKNKAIEKEEKEQAPQTRYIAIAKGFDGAAIRQKGDIFYSSIPKGSWMEECDDEGNLLNGEASLEAGKTE